MGTTQGAAVALVALLLLTTFDVEASTAHASVWAAMQAEPRLTAFTRMVEACESLRALLQDNEASVRPARLSQLQGACTCIVVNDNASRSCHLSQVTVLAPTDAALELLAATHPQLAADVASNALVAAALAAYHGAGCGNLHCTCTCTATCMTASCVMAAPAHMLTCSGRRCTINTS